jgi:hypothetical protein
MSQHKEQQGFLTFAKNTAETDYLRLAYVQALSIKSTQKINRVAVIVDPDTNELITDQHRAVFDYIIVANSEGPFDAEWQAFWLTPFKETIKVEADLLFTRSIDHWWAAFRLRDVVLSTGCRNYLQELSDVRKYRQVFDDNDLPDVYNGLMYFRYTQTARDFFITARRIFENWTEVRDRALKNYREDTATTDVVFALASKLVGQELTTLPSADYINFIHMKPAVNYFAESASFQDVYVTEFDEGMIRVNNINQYHPFHYYDKKFITEEMIEYYERSRIS